MKIPVLFLIYDLHNQKWQVCKIRDTGTQILTKWKMSAPSTRRVTSHGHEPFNERRSPFDLPEPLCSAGA
jgi:hypothetical protein